MATSGLSASEHRLLSTVVTESALLPDVSAMHDVYHPNVALYDTAGDRDWGANGHSGVHLPLRVPATGRRSPAGFYTTSMLHEFVLHRGQMRRCTLVHILYRMGFGAADVNHYLTYLDDSLFRRVYTDTRIGFLARPV